MDEAIDLGQVQELVEITHTHSRGYSLKTLTWLTLAIVAVMGGLYFLKGFPPGFDSYYAIMYFHAIGIGLAALASFLVIDVFKLERIEPALDFPIAYRAFWAVVLAALGGLVYLNPDVSNSLPDIGMLLFVLAFVLIADVGGAVLVELLILPRKLAGVYREETHSLVGYIGRMVPLSGPDRRAYASMSSGYWLAVVAVLGAFLAGLLGFINLWLRMFGDSFFAGYMSWQGLDTQGFQDATLDPHSHLIAVAIMAGIVAVAVVSFGVLKSESKVRRTLARIGVWVSIVGTVGLIVVMLAIALLSYAPPTFFTSGPDGANGMAGDDMVMSVIGLGAMAVVVAILMDRRVWKDGIRVLVLGTWVAAMVLNAAEGFYIEMNQDKFGGGTLAANDGAFKVAQPMTGIFILIALSVILLLVDFYRVEGRGRQIFAAVAGVGLLCAFAGVTLWTFADPSNNGVSFAIYIAGTGLTYVAFLIGALAIRTVRTDKYSLPAK